MLSGTERHAAQAGVTGQGWPTGRFRKKPVVIEAHQFMFRDADRAGRPEFNGPPPDWLKDAMAGPRDGVGSVWPAHDGLQIGTLEGAHFCAPGDWIIRGIKGELYPCKPDIFAATYEAVVA